MEFKLIFLDSFESDYNDKKYKIFRFLDPNSLQVITGTDFKEVFVPYKVYTCLVEFKNNKLKVIATH